MHTQHTHAHVHTRTQRTRRQCFWSLASPCCHHKISQAGAYKTAGTYPRSSGDWTSTAEDSASGSPEARLPVASSCGGWGLRDQGSNPIHKAPPLTTSSLPKGHVPTHHRGGEDSHMNWGGGDTRLVSSRLSGLLSRAAVGWANTLNRGDSPAGRPPVIKFTSSLYNSRVSRKFWFF